MADDERVRATGLAFHLTPERVWLDQVNATCYVPDAYSDEGFVHLTGEETHLLAVANRYYRGDDRPYLVLEIDLSEVKAAAVYDDPDCRYPHVYGPIETNAVAGVRRVQRGEDGTFVALGERFDLTTT